MRKIMDRILWNLIPSICMVLTLAGLSFADSLVDVSTVALDTTMVGTLGATIITGLAAMWGLRKVIKTVNRS